MKREPAHTAISALVSYLDDYAGSGSGSAAADMYVKKVLTLWRVLNLTIPAWYVESSSILCTEKNSDQFVQYS